MTDSLEARRAALVENLTRLGYTQTDRVEYGQWWDGATSDGGVLVLNADKLDSPDADHTMVRAERYIAPLLAIEAAAFARGVESQQGAGDEYHSLDELYEYRMLYNAHAARGWLAEGIPVVKSHWHSDGEPCFGGGWFIVTAQLPSGQVSNHYRDEFWGLFDVPEVALPPEYDGHTPADASKRLSDALAAPPARPPVDVEAALDEWLAPFTLPSERDELIGFTRAELLDLLRTVTTREDGK